MPFTYPPLFHYVALFISFLGLSVFDAVKLFGAISFAFFPLAMYFIGSLFGKKAGIFSLVFALIGTNIFMVLIFSEFPEIFSFDLFAMFVYFYFRNRFELSGIFLGLTAISHPFTAFFAAVSAIVLFVLKRDRNTVKTLSIGFLISLFWLPKYLEILGHFSGGTWNNTRWYASNGFVGLEGIWNAFLRLNPLIVLLSIIGIFSLYSKRNRLNVFQKYFTFLYIFPLVFTIYHYSPAQYKFLDILTIPFVIFSGVGASHLIDSSKNIRRKTAAIFVIALFFIASVPFPLLKIQEHQLKFSVISSNVEEAAKWLRQYDSRPSRILIMLNSSRVYKDRLVFESELVFSQIANKIPLDGTISDLESYTPEYRKQLEDREEMINGNLSLVRNYGVVYIISGAGKCPFETIYEKNGVEVCSMR